MAQINIPLGKEPGVPYGYMAFTPDGYTDIGFNIHGWGERGNGTTELNLVDNVGVARAIAEGKYPGGSTIAWLSPQYPKTAEMMYHKTLYNYIRSMCTKYKVPTDRVHLYGLSGGGNTANSFMINLEANNALYPNLPPIKVKSVVMIACGPSYSKASLFINTKVWLIIGDSDGRFKWQSSKLFIDNYNAANPKAPGRFTLMPFMDHEGPVWNNPAKNKEVIEWMTS